MVSKDKRILNGKYKQVIAPQIENGCIVLDGYPIKYTQKRYFDWRKFTTAETHREQYIILVNHLDNL